MWGILAVIAVYNVIHFGIMIYGFHQGYAHGPQGALKVGKVISAEKASVLSLAIPVLCGAGLAIAPGQLASEYFVAIPIFTMSLVALYKKIDYILIFYISFILILIMTIIR
jgi:hypothetical protein